MLIGARGNSGVILSQFFKGIYEELRRCSIANSGELRDAFINAYKMAYKAVSKPTEGTILTVAREGIEDIKDQISRFTKIDVFFAIYVAEMKKTLSYTPELLPILKEAGVVDSGGAGYICIVEGMLMYLHDEVVDLEKNKEAQYLIEERNSFNCDSVFSLGYKVEYRLQLLNNKQKVDEFDLDEFIKLNKDYVSEESFTKECDNVIANFITFTPDKAIEVAQKFGEFSSFVMSNLDITGKVEKKFVGKID